MSHKTNSKAAVNFRELLSNIPSMTELIQHDRIVKMTEKYPESYIHKCLRASIDELRQNILKGWIQSDQEMPASDQITLRAATMVEEGLSDKLMRVINGAGVILHTGLGRAPLAASAQNALHQAAARYCLLATDRQTGKRGDRNSHNEELLREITGAEAALIVNNNSAAVMLALNTMGMNKESIVSRGELVEIGGAFRVPDVMRRSQTIMVGVGCTNKTHLRDYAEAITEETAVLLKVHTSNYRIEGFHKEVTSKELSELAQQKNLTVVLDIGSGALVDLRRWGLAYEPTVQEAVADGADVITFSGDKMVGGPQCGIIVGKKKYIDQMKVNPLMRAFRCGKLTHSTLNGTLRLFLNPDTLPETHPVYAMIAIPLEVVARRASRIKTRLKKIADETFNFSLCDGLTEMGSGSLPARGIPSRLVTMTSTMHSSESISLAFRQATPPVFTRIEADRVMFDARTISDEEVPWLDKSFRQVLTTFKK